MDEKNLATKTEKAPERKKLLLQLLSAAVFLLLLGAVFCKVTYLYRGGDDEQIYLKGIESADADVVYVGGSASFMYWQPPRAWAEQGISSYCYGTNGIQAENLLPYVREVLRYQDPELLILDARPFQYWSPEFDEAGLRKGSDAMSLWSPNRYRLIRDTFRYRQVPEDEDILSYYLDIAKYHVKPWALASDNAWKYAFRHVEAPFGGGRFKGEHMYLDTPAVEPGRPEPLADSSRELLDKLLQFCREENLQVLLVVSPHYETQEQRNAYREIGRITESYGFRFLNANEYYDEMGLDFARDFYDKNHVNLLGAGKFTTFLGSYLRQNYELPDRGEDGDWAQSWEAWQIQTQAAEADIRRDIAAMEANLQISQQLPLTEDFGDWAALTESGEYLILAAGRGLQPEDPAQRAILKAWGLDRDPALAVVEKGQVLDCSLLQDSLAYEGSTADTYPVSYSLRLEDGAAVLTVDGETLKAEGDSLAIVAVDSLTRKTADRLILTLRDGSLEITR